MLWTPENEWGWSTDSFGANMYDDGFGTSLATGGVANTKTSVISVMSALAEDAYFLWFGFCGSGSSAASSRFLVDVYFDPAGGTSWEASPRIANLFLHQPDYFTGMQQYAFPLFVKAGTSIGMASQSQNTTQSLRASVMAFGKPSRPELVRCGSKVTTFGANSSGATAGTTIAPGNATWGSYTASLGTVADPYPWWWQAGIGFNDTTMTGCGYLLDVAIGDASNKRLALRHNCHVVAVEQGGKPWASFGGLPILSSASGNAVYARAAGNAGADATPTVVVYGLGG